MTDGGPMGQALGGLEVEDVTVRYGGLVAVDEASLEIAKGTTFGLIGPNGAGKSTLLGAIAGSVDATSGTVRYLGENILGLAAYDVARRGIGRTFQVASTFPRLSVLDNVMVGRFPMQGDTLTGALFGGRRWKLAEKLVQEDALGWLEQFGLTEQSALFASELSGGQRRLMEIARALMGRPTLLLLDEPMAGVSPQMSGVVLDHLMALKEQGMSILIVEHEMSAVERLCDTVAVMALGRIIAQGELDDVIGRDEVRSAYAIR